MQKIHITKGFVRRRKMSPSKCAPGSFRTITTGRRHERIICCPRGHFKRGRCRVGTVTQSVLTRRKKRR